MTRPAAITTLGGIATVLATSIAAQGAARREPAPQETARGRGVAAELYYTKQPDGCHVKGMRLRIRRAGLVALDAPIPPHPRYPSSDFLLPGRKIATGRSVIVRDLDGDGEPEVVLDLFWGGQHCCWWWRVYGFDTRLGRYRVTTKLWGDAPVVPTLRDVDQDAKPELVSSDARFTGVFAGYANSFRPVQIWSFTNGRLVDVSRAHLREVARDAARIRRWVTKLAPDGRAAGAAWAAEQALLGRAENARGQMNIWARQRVFDGNPSTDPPNEPVRVSYVAAVWRLLRVTSRQVVYEFERVILD